MRRIAPWLAPLLFLSLGGAYLLLPRFSLAFNQACEMLATGNTQGLMMFFHAAGTGGFLFSAAIGMMAFLIPFLKPAYLLESNMAFFGGPAGIVLTLLSGFSALVILLLAGCTVLALCPDRVRTRLTAIPRLRYFLLLGLGTWMLTRLN